MKLFNTLTGKKELFKPLKKVVTMYNCGPTVYDFSHIGNLRSYVFADLLRRYLEYKGFKVKQVVNITDVDDKTIKGSQEEGISLKEFTKRYEKAFFEDIEKLKIKKASFYPRATEHINEMVNLIKKLLAKGYAYKTEDGIYFDISKFKNYGKLSKFKIRELKAGARVREDLYEKEEAQDFALWKFWREEDGENFWVTDVGKGRPGWHIECSAMSMKYLGKTIDIHTGGVDLIFPHHENEIAQSESVTGKKFVRYWLHCEHLLVENQKMAKSLGNVITLRDLLEKYDARSIRFLLMSAHYKSQLNFTYDSLNHAKETVNKLNDFVSRIKFLTNKVKAKENKRILTLIKNARSRFERHMDDDLDVPRALAVVHDLIYQINKEIDKRKIDKKSLVAVFDFLTDVNKIFDFIELKKEKLTKEEKTLILKREKLRKKKRFKEADEIRSALRKRGIILEDTPYGVRWKKL